MKNLQPCCKPLENSYHVITFPSVELSSWPMLPNDHQQVALGHQGRIQKATVTRRCKLKHIKNHAVGHNMTLGNLSGIGLLRFVFAFLNLCCPKGMFLQFMFAGCRRQRRISLGHHFRKLSFIYLHIKFPHVCVSWNRCCSFLPLIKAKVRIELQGPMIFGRLYPSAFLAESQHATPGTLEKGSQ